MKRFMLCSSYHIIFPPYWANFTSAFCLNARRNFSPHPRYFMASSLDSHIFCTDLTSPIFLFAISLYFVVPVGVPVVALLTVSAVHGIYCYSLRRDGCPKPAITYTLMDFVTASVCVSIISHFSVNHTAYMGLGSLARHGFRMPLSLSVPMRFMNYATWPLSNKSKSLFLSSTPERDSGCPALTGEADYGY